MPSLRKPRPTVLLTGFGPFPGVPENASGVLARRLAVAARKQFPEFAFRSTMLPTEWASGPRRLARLIEETQPILALHFGVSERARGFEVETRARNLCAVHPDAAGAYPEGVVVMPGGSEFALCTLPVPRVVERLRSLGLPAEASDDAGAYLCNAVLYHSLCRAETRGKRTIAGFIHIPASLIDGAGGSLDWEAAVRGGLEIIAVGLEEAAAVGREKVPPVA